MKKIFTLVFLSAITFTCFSQIRISQVYGGGGNTGAPYNQDFVELFNASASSIDISGYSVQYASSAGTSWSVTTIPASTSVGAGKYFLIALATGATGSPLPAADLTNTLVNLSGTTGKVALVNNAVALSGATACSGATVVDVVGYGSGASCSETSPAPTASNTTSLIRAGNGCTDANNNSTDFSAVAPAPRNSATVANLCSGPVATLSVNPSSLTFTADLGVTTAPQTFTISGSTLSGAAVSIAPSAGIEVSLSSGSGYVTNPSSLSVPYTAPTLNATTIYVRVNASAPQGALAGTATCSGGGAASNAVVNIAGGVYQNYYNTKANLGLTNLGTWSNTTDGTGPSPAAFSTAYQNFNIISQANANYTGVWDVSNAGNTAKIIVGNGTAAMTLTVLPGVDSITSASRVDVLNNATLVIQNNRRPFLNNLATGSTVEYAQAGLTTTDTIKVATLSYHHLKLTNGIKILSSGTTTIRGNLTISGVINFNGAPSPFSTVNAFGDVNFTGGTTFEPLPTGDNARLTLAMNGSSGLQAINGAGVDVFLFRLQRDTTSTDDDIIVSPGTNLTLGNTSGGGLRLNQGGATATTLILDNTTLKIIRAGLITTTALGKISTANSNISIEKANAATSTAGILRFATGSTLNQLTVNLDPALTRDSIVIADNVTVNGSLTLTKGKAVMGTGATLTLGSTATVSGASTTSFVDGLMRRSGAAAFTYPVGKGSKYAPVAFANFVGGNNYSVQYFNTGYGNYAINPATSATYPAYNVSNNEYWVITKNTGTSVDLTFNYTDANSYINNPAAIRMAHFGTIDWNDIAGTPGGANNGTTGNVTVTGVNAFSPFTFAATSAGVIPVKLSSFAVQKLNNAVKISWATEQEINSKEFVIEKSVDGRNWQTLTVVNAAGNSNVKINYTAMDNNPAKGINFYRLKQVDNNGRFEYSATKSVLFSSSYQVLIAPNPAADFINVLVSKNNIQPITVSLIDISGKKLFEEKTTDATLQIKTNGFAKGIYFVKVADANNVTTKKIIIQ